jgi:serine/threonine-protein kinase
MDVDHWRRVERVLDDALAQDDSEWSALLDERCAGDPALRSQVSALLDRITTARGFLERAPAAAAAELIAEVRDRESAGTYEGRRIGAYRIVREIGRGGMARVYLAERADGAFQQRVALKLLRSNLDSEIDQSRFRIERQILASLNHPNIARLLDGGVTDDGLPYLVLEYVEGLPIDLYCDEHASSVPERLAIFATVARATQSAHNSLVVHRDLKPSNILVAADGTVKLLDFGLAKLLEPDATMQPLATRAEHRWMTPEYAAPEQIRGDPVTTFTDVYQLGVVLYELLAGELPFAASARSTHELETAILNEDPPLPSTKKPALRGDLDAIVMKALCKEPQRRYASPTALVDDLTRYQEGRPVIARRASAAYRVRKFVRRHKVAVLIAMLAIASLGAAAFRERSLRARAETEARKSRAVEDYLVRVFDVADPYAPPDGRGAELTARSILDRGAARIDSVLVGQADVQAELRQVIGRVYNNLGLFDRAVPMLRRSLEQRRALYGARHPLVAQTLDDLGEALMKQDKLTEAEAKLREALEQRRALFADRNAATAESIDHLAEVLVERDQLDAAEPLYREALVARSALFGDQDALTAQSLNHLGLLLWRKGKYDEAEPLYRQALAIQEKRLGPDHPETAETVHNLAQTQYSRGKLDESEALFRRALAAKRKTLGKAHPSVTVNMNNLAVLLARGKGELVESEALAREALALDRQIFGERHGYVAASLDNLASILKLKGDFAAATPIYRQALEINRSLLGPEHNAIALNLNNLGTTYQITGNYPEAIALFRESAAQYQHLLGDKHPNLATVRLNLARALRESGNQTEAEQIYRSVATTMDSSKANQRAPWVQSQLGLGQVLITQGKLAEAKPMLEQALAAVRKQVGDTSWRSAEARLALGVCLSAAGDRARAEPLLRDAVALTERVQRAQPTLSRRARAELARFEARGGRSRVGLTGD